MPSWVDQDEIYRIYAKRPTGMIVDHEILRQQLQHHTVFRQLDVQGAIHRAVDIPLFDLTRPPEIHPAAAVGSARREAALAARHTYNDGAFSKACTLAGSAEPSCRVRCTLIG